MGRIDVDSKMHADRIKNINLSVDFKEFVDYMSNYGEKNKLKIHVMHEDIFNSMHKI